MSVFFEVKIRYFYSNDSKYLILVNDNIMVCFLNVIINIKLNILTFVLPIESTRIFQAFRREKK